MSNLLLKVAAQAASSLPQSWIQAIYRNPRLAGLLVRPKSRRSARPGLGADCCRRPERRYPRAGYANRKRLLAGDYEPNLQQAIQELVQPGWVVFDVGANIGYISLLLAKAVTAAGHVYAFEALPDNYSRVQKNIQANFFQDTITPIHAAVIDATRQVTFLVGPSNGMGKVSGSAGRQEVIYEEISDRARPLPG